MIFQTWDTPSQTSYDHSGHKPNSSAEGLQSRYLPGIPIGRSSSPRIACLNCCAAKVTLLDHMEGSCRLTLLLQKCEEEMDCRMERGFLFFLASRASDMALNVVMGLELPSWRALEMIVFTD